MPKSLCILGRQPQLGLAELESLYGAEHIFPLIGAALLDIEVRDISFRRLGGTIKLAKVLNILPTTHWSELEKYLVENVPQHLKYLPNGSFTLGLSVYGLRVPVSTINRSLLKLKKLIRKNGRRTRVVPNKTPELNSAQVLHNKLTSKGAWELLLVADGKQTILAQTMFVQDIEAYAARDQARPKRDARVGMLPPKLAQIIINLAKPPSGSVVLDPFCGSGVILQEALLMGFDVIGTDNDPRMAEFAKANIEWLKNRHPEISAEVRIELADATSHHWPAGIGAVASEAHLGPPLKSKPSAEDLKPIISDVNETLEGFLANLAGQVNSGSRLCLAIPAWRVKNGDFVYLPLIDHLPHLGYNQLALKHVEPQVLVYFRENQMVARQLIILVKN